jgi:hypothetical protein
VIVSKFLMPILLPVIIGPLTFLVMQGLKALSATIDKLPPTAKRIAVMVVATFLTFLGSWAGVDFNCDPEAAVNCLSTIDQDAVKAAVATGLAFVLHLAKQKKG